MWTRGRVFVCARGPRWTSGEAFEAWSFPTSGDLCCGFRGGAGRGPSVGWPLDIADLTPPIAFHVASLGDVQVDARAIPFEKWVRAGKAEARWPSGEAFVRDLALEQIRSGPDKQPIDPALVGALDDAQLAAVADAFLSASGEFFRPRYIATQSGGRRKVRKRRADEAYDLGPRESEPVPDQLLRILGDWAQDTADRMTMVMAADQGAIAAKLLAEQKSSIMSAIESYDRLTKSPAFDPALTSAAKMAASLQSSSIAGLLAAAKPPSHLFPAYEMAARMTELTSLSKNLASLSHPAWLGTMKSLGAYPSVVQSLHAAIGKDVTGFARLLDAQRATSRSLDDALGIRTFEFWKDQRLFADAVNRQFHLHLPSAVLAAASLMSTSPNLAIAGSDLSIFPPGYQLAATIGLEGIASRGAVADVLRFYDDEPDASAPVFGAALDSAHGVDRGEFSAAETIGVLERLWAQVADLLAGPVSQVQRAGLLNLLSFILTVVMALTAVETLRVGATSADIIGVREAVVSLKGEIGGLKTPPPSPSERIRYVHAPAPLRTEPHKGGQVMRIVYPDETLRLVDEQGDWMKVEVFDFHAQHLVLGWMNRRWVRAKPRD